MSSSSDSSERHPSRPTLHRGPSSSITLSKYTGPSSSSSEVIYGMISGPNESDLQRSGAHRRLPSREVEHDNTAHSIAQKPLGPSTNISTASFDVPLQSNACEDAGYASTASMVKRKPVSSSTDRSEETLSHHRHSGGQEVARCVGRSNAVKRKAVGTNTSKSEETTVQHDHSSGHSPMVASAFSFSPSSSRKQSISTTDSRAVVEPSPTFLRPTQYARPPSSSSAMDSEYSSQSHSKSSSLPLAKEFPGIHGAPDGGYSKHYPGHSRFMEKFAEINDLRER